MLALDQLNHAPGHWGFSDTDEEPIPLDDAARSFWVEKGGAEGKKNWANGWTFAL